MKKQPINPSQTSNRETQNTMKKKLFTVLVPIVLVVIIIAAIVIIKQPFAESKTVKSSSQTILNQAGDLVIPISSISSKATFYPVTVDGAKLEVLAVMAPDKTIRTAFNTCQVCYDSGRGYYKQEGNVLVCQNCGNRFKMSQVEVTKGGCNPVPIFDEDITIDQTNLTIPADYLRQSAQIFKDWKTT